MRFCITLFLFLAATVTQAQDLSPDRFYVTLGSSHIGGGDDLNEFNPGVLVSWQNRFATLDYTAGAYIDSHKNPALRLSVAKLWDINSVTEAGVDVAYVVPLKDDERPFMIPTLQLNYRNFFVNGVGAFEDGDFVGVIGFGMTFKH